MKFNRFSFGYSFKSFFAGNGGKLQVLKLKLQVPAKGHFSAFMTAFSFFQPY